MILVAIGRSVSDLKVHLVLTTKYRKKAFTGEMLKRLHEILEDLLGKWDCKLVEFNGEEEHVHVLFQYHPNATHSAIWLIMSNLLHLVKLGKNLQLTSATFTGKMFFGMDLIL